MADDIRLYMFESGTLKCHVENIKMNQGLGDPYEIPVPWFLIEHDRGLVVVDGALKQQRLLVIAPREPDAEDLAAIYRASLRNW